jgi:hypothetical protein
MSDALLAALKRKFQTPQDALEVLGLDSALLEEGAMAGRPNNSPPTLPTSKMTPAAMMAKGALFTYLQPKLAKGMALDYNSMVTGITSKNYTMGRNRLRSNVVRATDGKLAQDADLEDLGNLIDALKGGVENADQMMTTPASASPPTAPADAAEEDLVAKIKAYLEEQGVSPEILNNLDAFAAEQPSPNGPNGPPESEQLQDNALHGQDEDDDDLGPRGETDLQDIMKGDQSPANQGSLNLGGEDEEDDEDKKAEDDMVPNEQEELLDGVTVVKSGGASDSKFVTRTAMDKAIKMAQDRAISNQRAIRDAERFVRPWVGEIAMDAAAPADIYRSALKALGVKGYDKMHPDALRPVLEAQPRPSAKMAADRRLKTIAQDAKPDGSFFERFPEAGKIRLQ